MKTRHPRRSRAEWAEIIEQQSQSGLTIRSFCEQNDIALASFGKWKHRLKKDPATNETGPMFEPVVIDESQDSHSPKIGSSSVTLTLGANITLTIRSHDSFTS